MARGHSDVDDDGVRPLVLDKAEELVSVLRGAADLEADITEHAGQAVPNDR
jgi:hypothetical protein